MTGKIKLVHSGGNSVSIAVPTSNPSASEVEFKLPSSDGSANQVLKTDGSGNLSFGEDAGGKILQVVSVTKTNTASFSVGSGGQYSYTDTSFRATITPASASNKILIQVIASVSVDSSQWIHISLQKDGSDISGAIGDADGSRNRATHFQGYPPDGFDKTVPVPILYLDTAGNTTSRYYNLGFSHTSGLTRTMYLNRSGSTDNNNFNYARPISTITVMEIAA
tara:strand:- start:496 stop:1161 length:666 start_codon:yes stop_codon:yes gene_type:complete